MKTNTLKQIELTVVKALATFALAVLVNAAAFAAEAIRYEATTTGNKCTITGASGDSALSHDWTMESPMIGGYIEADEKFPEATTTDMSAGKPTVYVKMPVRTFKSGKDTMNERMQIMMKATQFANIEYRLVELKPKSKAGATGALEFEAVGTLAIAGKTNTCTMLVTIEKKDTKLVIKGSAPIKMTTYGITPKVSLPILGDISIKDEVKIDFEWQLAKKVK